MSNYLQPLVTGFFLLLIFPCYTSAQTQEEDSLLILLQKETIDTERVSLMNELAWFYWYNQDYKKSADYAQTALKISEEINYIRGISVSNYYLAGSYAAQEEYQEALKHFQVTLKIDQDAGNEGEVAVSFIEIGNIYSAMGNHQKAIEYYRDALKINQSLGNLDGQSRCYNNLGVSYTDIGDFAKGIENYYQSLKISESVKDSNGMAGTYNNIGIIYHDQGNLNEALKHYQKAADLNEKINNQEWLANNFANIGIIHKDQKNFNEAQKFNEQALRIHKQLENRNGMASTIANIGGVYQDQGNYKEAREQYLKAISIAEPIGMNSSLALYYNNMASVNLLMQNFSEAKTYAEKGLKLSLEAASKDYIAQSYKLISLVDSANGNWKSAYSNHKLFKVYNDSIYNAESSEKIAEMDARYDSEKKEAQIKLLEIDKQNQAAVAAAESKKQKAILGSVLGGLLLVLLFSGFVYNRWKITQKQKAIIESQKILVDSQKMIVEEKNKDITDSINYAKRIQEAKLPALSLLRNSFPESFVLFKPKDIVSGDFYWYHQNSESCHLAAADCTGHGVPGAFMSLIGSEKLDEAVRLTAEPAKMLALVNQGIKKSLSQSSSSDSTRDGMDIALCRFQTVNNQTRVTYAGANRPLWISKHGSENLEEVKATKKAIGGLTDSDQSFSQHEVILGKGDTVYMFSDGFADTFNGKTSKKLMTKRFRQLLQEIQHLSMAEQEEYLHTFTENWKAGVEQVDDILVMGVRV